MDKKSTGLTVAFIDKEHRTAFMEYDGCSIALAFSKQRNPDIRDSLKEVLISSVINQTAESHNCLRV